MTHPKKIPIPEHLVYIARANADFAIKENKGLATMDPADLLCLAEELDNYLQGYVPKKPKRNIVSYHFERQDKNWLGGIFALCDDNTLWFQCNNSPKWNKVSDIPQDDNKEQS